MSRRAVGRVPSARLPAMPAMLVTTSRRDAAPFAPRVVSLPALFKGWLYDCGLMADRESSPPVARPALVRAISRFDLTAAVVNGVIGSAIFGLPAGLAALTGAWVPLALLLFRPGVLTVA